MNSLKTSQALAVAAGVAFFLYLIYTHLQYFGNISFLGGALLIEIIIASLWKYDQRFFGLLMIGFLWAGMHVPAQDAWTAARWLVLAAGAFTGFVIWMKTPRSHFKLIHLLAFFCVGAAFVSASVSHFVQMASFKAFSLLLLFLYCSSGIRLAVLGREDRFFRGLVLCCEGATFGTALCYFVLGYSIWGNPNALGAAMSIGVFPILLWGWVTTPAFILRSRRLAALLLCVFLVFYSMARAAMVTVFLVTLFFCICLRQYKLLTKVTGFVLLAIAISGVFAPNALKQTLSSFRDAVLYKGHRESGILGSRKTPWEETISSIKRHPYFGTGYGTSPTGEDPGLNFGKFASSAETVREHGSSYMMIAEWVGLFGIVPFLALLAVTVSNLWRVSAFMRRSANPFHYSIPLAMVLLAGFVHASFEDWLFAVGSYPCIYFWSFAFLLADFLPAAAPDPLPAVFGRALHRQVALGPVVPHRPSPAA